jgi:hypothetical protein
MLLQELLARIACLVVVGTAGCAVSPAPAPAGESVERTEPGPSTTTGTEAPGPQAASTGDPEGPPPAPVPSSPTKPAPVTFRILSYNVAGLPQGISSSDPLVNTPQISPKLNPFELVLVQEDFSYHDALVASATHPHLSTPMATSADLGDGLNTLSRFPFGAFSRTKWSECNGIIDQSNDCLTPKGFSRFVLDLGGGRTVDVYNMHFDAGRGQGDVAARNAQVDQLNAAIAQHSAGKAVIVAGDTNMKASDEVTLQKLLTGSSLACACRTLKCAEPERIDRIMFRSSATITLTPKNFAVESSFVDVSGEPLSDHEPVSATFDAE